MVILFVIFKLTKSQIIILKAYFNTYQLSRLQINQNLKKLSFFTNKNSVKKFTIFTDNIWCLLAYFRNFYLATPLNTFKAVIKSQIFSF